MALHCPSFRLVGGVALCLRKPRLQLYRRTAVSASTIFSATKARFVARRSESSEVQQLQRPLADYMALPASQYSVLDAQRIERVDENTFRCYVYRIKFFTFEVCPVLVVRVEEEPYGCCIRLLSCKVMLFITRLSLPVPTVFVRGFIPVLLHQLEGSPLVEAQNDKFSGNSSRMIVALHSFPGTKPSRQLRPYSSMVNKISYDTTLRDSQMQQLTTDTIIEVTVEIPFLFRGIPTNAIESTGTQVLEQLLGIMLPRFLNQLVKDYQAWASGDNSRKAVGTGEI
ncbi:hypothetical protein MA16_Dca021185 [Dendrobium catenatum]|uniref:Uncharacterized protein n=1 Tax=Dendrobium catenatum TaxID=906689 RepID=A0A2I0WH11_9ASPA|nr:hypothetical protein MA16_Dca021185 [Dendrobium catenatum]